MSLTSFVSEKAVDVLLSGVSVRLRGEHLASPESTGSFTYQSCEMDKDIALMLYRLYFRVSYQGEMTNHVPLPLISEVKLCYELIDDLVDPASRADLIARMVYDGTAGDIRKIELGEWKPWLPGAPEGGGGVMWTW